MDAAYTKLCDAHDAADEAAEAALPRVDGFFDEYRLGMSMKRDAVEFHLQLYNTRERVAGKPQIDIAATAEEFERYRREHEAIARRFRVKELDQRCQQCLPTYRSARDALMAVPAPDQAALLIKMEIATVPLDEEHAESALADARRLLSDGRA